MLTLDQAQDRIAAKCEQVKSLLLAKNASYGNSVFAPTEVMSKAPASERIAVQIDHKLSRLQKGHAYQDEDTLLDLTGYLVLLMIQIEHEYALASVPF
jgi:hypothetical protein